MKPDLNLGDTQAILHQCKQERLPVKEAAYVLATSYWETNKTMVPVKEAYWLSENWRKDNLRYYPWYGRGYVQLTWEDNYKKASKEIGVDLISNPDVALNPTVAAKILVKGMIEGWFTGKKLSDYNNYVAMRHIINGSDKANVIASIAQDYEKALLASGYTALPDKQEKPPTAPSQSLLEAIIKAIVAALTKGTKK